MISALFLAALLQNTVAGAVPGERTTASNGTGSSGVQQTGPIPNIFVRSQRQEINYAVDSSLSTLVDTEILEVAPRHPNEIFSRVPGVWVSNGSGQEHLTGMYGGPSFGFPTRKNSMVFSPD